MSDSCDLMDYSSSGPSVHGFSQARVLEWVAIFFSRGSSRHRDQAVSPALAGGFFTTEPPGKPPLIRQRSTQLNLSLDTLYNVLDLMFFLLMQSIFVLLLEPAESQVVLFEYLL